MNDKTICGVLDAQGFIENNVFLPREIAIADKYDSMCIEIDPQIDVESLSEVDRVTNRHISLRYTGLDYKPQFKNFLPIQLVDTLLIHLYHFFKKSSNDVFGIRKPQLAKLLDKNSIPYVIIDSPNMETLNKYYGPGWLCKFHTVSATGRCALCKAEFLNRWITDRDKMEKFLISIKPNFKK
jgi:hypothetical protein